MKRKTSQKPVPSSSIGRYLAGLDNSSNTSETAEQATAKKKRTPKVKKPAKEHK